MFITKQRTTRPSYLINDHSNVEFVDEFKLLGITIRIICLLKSKFNSSKPSFNHILIIVVLWEFILTNLY